MINVLVLEISLNDFLLNVSPKKMKLKWQN